MKKNSSGNKKKNPNKKVRYEEMNQVRTKKKFNWGRFLIVILTIAIIFGTLGFLFHTRKTEIRGTVITSEKDINTWFKKDIGNRNTIYSYCKMNYFDCNYPPTVEKIKVDFVRPWHIVLNVKEKDVAAYVDYKKKYLCFDADGRAMYISDTPVSRATYVEGMKIDSKKVKIGEVIPVKDEAVFKNIVDISRVTEKYKLNPDRIVCHGSNINICFGDVEVMLGNSDYEIRIAQIPPILKELQENYSEEKGVLHLENFHASDKTVRFVPEKDDKQE